MPWTGFGSPSFSTFSAPFSCGSTIEADPSFDAARKIAVEEAEREDDFGRVSGLYKRNWVKTTAVAISCLFWPLIALVFLFDRVLDKR